MNRLCTSKVSIILAMCCSIIFMNILGNFSFEQAYSQDLISNSYNIENLNEHFNIAIGGDWGCEEDTEKTVENIQNKNPELVIAAGDLSYEESADCWFEIIQPLKSKMKIAMGDHEYSDTSSGEKGIIDQYLKPLNLQKTYYSFDINNVHVIGTVGRSLYELEGQSPFVANQYDEQFGFLNIDIYSDKALRGTFYINEDDNLGYYHVSNTNDNIADHFIISNMKLSGATS
jgi:predicted MPP superfamily phosphohydrolase